MFLGVPLTRVRVRWVAAVAAVLMAAIYFLIGLGILPVGGSKNGEMVDLFVFGFGAGSMFLGTAALLLLIDRRWLWVLVAIVQVWIYVVYIGASAGREPAFEPVGITLRLIQLPLLAALIYLSWKPAIDLTPRRLAR